MKKITEVRWHGRGGQGAKTVALLFADAALSTGKYIQGFPEYGPERMGAPMMSFNRLSDEPIKIHCGVSSPDVVVVLDPTLLGTIDVTEGLPKNGILIVNTPESPKEIRKRLKLTDRRVFTVDASKISLETLGKNIPNTPMLGAMVKITGLLDFQKMLEDTESKLTKKFRGRTEIVEGNMACIKRAAQEVKSE
jgi:pyruvate ferredoxin oxidoreductase gamma subunit